MNSKILRIKDIYIEKCFYSDIEKEGYVIKADGFKFSGECRHIGEAHLSAINAKEALISLLKINIVLLRLRSSPHVVYTNLFVYDSDILYDYLISNMR